MWQYLAAHQATLGARPLKIPVAATIRFSAGLAGYVAATLVALVSPQASVVMYAAIALYYLFEHLPDPVGADVPAESRPPVE